VIKTGQVIWFDIRKGQGFIRSDDAQDLPVNYHDIEDFGKNLGAGDRVAFQIEQKPEGAFAVGVIVTERTPKRTTSSRRKETSAPDSSLLVAQALLAKQRKQYDKARRLFENAIEQAPKPEIFFSYAAMEKEIGKYDRAGEVLKKGIEKFPEYGKFYEDYGMVELRRNPEQAARIFREGISRAPSHKILHRFLGEVLYHLGGKENLKESARQFELARKAGRLDEQSQRLARLVDVLVGNRRGRNAVEFLRSASLSVEQIIPHRIHSYAVDFSVRPQAVEYTESYDLVDEILVRCFFKNNIEVKDVVDFIRDVQAADAPRPRSRDVGFIVVQNSSEIKDYLYRLLEGAGRNPTVVPIDETVMKAALESRDAEAVLKQILDEWLYRRNLYEENFPVSGRRFFGREQELAALTRAIDTGTPIGLFGLRKVGKTSLLKKLREKRPQDLVVYIDLQSVPSGVTHASYLYWEMANQLREELLGKFPKSLHGVQFSLAGKYTSFTTISNVGLVAAQFDADLRAINRNTSGISPKIVILLDEIERLLPTQNSPGFSDFVDFLAYLRGRSQQDSNFVPILTGANPAVCEVSQWAGRDNPVFKFFKEMFLPPLEKLECDEMVSRLGRGMGVTSYTKESLRAIYTATGGHPFVTRQLCSRIAKQFPGRPLSVDTPEVMSGIDEFLFQDSGTFKEILDRLERDYPREKELLLFIADGVNSETDLAGLIGPDVHEGLRHLVGYQLVERAKDKYRIKMGLLLQWIQRYWLGAKT
jgi:cold shock CspA family protein